MRSIVALLLVLTLAGCGGGRGYRPNPDGYLPDGSWRETCRDASVRGDNLRAVCRSLDGDWRESRIDFGDCRSGRVENNNGRLVCERGGGGGGNWPGNRDGSYLNSCRDVRQDGPIIRARCREQDGDWRDTRIDARECGQDIANIDGRLTCVDYNDGRWRRR